jgi:hypothetical protein
MISVEHIWLERSYNLSSFYKLQKNAIILQYLKASDP